MVHATARLPLGRMPGHLAKGRSVSMPPSQYAAIVCKRRPMLPARAQQSAASREKLPAYEILRGACKDTLQRSQPCNHHKQPRRFLGTGRRPRVLGACLSETSL